MASVTLVALSAVSGVPLFIRHRGAGKPPSYNIIGSLNGVLMFGDSQGTKLLDSCTPNTTVTWKTYHDSVRLILLHGEPQPASSTGSLPSMCTKLGAQCDKNFLDLVFSSLILMLSVDALTSNANVERLKKDLKVCFPLLDTLLERCETVGGGGAPAVGGPGPLFSHLVQCADTVLPPDNYNLQSEVQKWSEVHCNSSYSCLISANGRVLAGSRTYWCLSATELVLLPMLLLSAPLSNTARDVPVYLPQKSPKVPFRLLGIKLTCHVWAMALCGPSPSLASIVRSAGLFWGPYYAGMETLAATQPYNMTASARQALDKSVLGLLLVNYESKRCISCVHLGSSTKNSISSKASNSSKSSIASPPPSATNTIASSKSNNNNSSKSNSNDTSTLDLNSHNTLGSETRSRKSRHAQSPPPSHTSTLKSSNGKSSKVHYYQTAEYNISKTASKPERAMSPKDSTSSSPSKGTKNAPSQSSTLSRHSRALSPSSNCAARALSPSSIRSSSPLASNSKTSSLLTPSFKMTALALVYRSLASGLLQVPAADALDKPNTQFSDGHSITEAYVWCGSCRVYVLQSPSQHLLVLLPSALPHTLARSVAYKTLDVFLKAKALKL